MVNWLTLVRHLAAQCNVSLKIGGNGCPCTDGKSVFLPALPTVLKEEDRTEIIFWMVHETSHILYSNFTLLFKNTSQYSDSIYFMANNVLEDTRIDILRHLINKPMARWRRLYFKCEKRADPALFDMQWMLLISVYLESAFIDDRILEAGDKLKTIKKEVAKREPGLEIKLESALSVIRSDVVSMVSDKNSTSEDALAISLKFLDALDYFEKNEDDQDSDGDSEENADEDPDEDGDQDQGDGKGESENDDPESSDDDNSNGGSDQEDSDQDDTSGDQAGENTDSNQGENSGEGDLSDQGSDSTHISIVDIEELMEKINKDPEYQEIPKIDNPYLNLEEQFCPEDLMHLNNSLAGISGSIKRLQSQLEDMLEDLAAVDTSYEETGRIKGKSIARVCCGKTNVFQQKSDIELPVKYLTLIVDVSGSMHRNYLPAMQACGMLMTALGGIDVDYSVIAFGRGIFNIKRVSDSTRKGLARLGGSESVINGTTPMAEALAIAIDECPPEMDKHNVIIITDGSPDNAQSVVETADYYDVRGVKTNLLSVGINPTWADNTSICAAHIDEISELPAALLRMSESIFSP